MVLRLYDWYGQASQDLLYSLLTADIEGCDVVLNDDGFLPAGIDSAYAYFCGFNQGQVEQPLYFNQVQVPTYWQIAGNNNQAEVYDYKTKKATIFYQVPGHLRLVKAVDWLGENGKVALTEHYNKHGWCFAKTNFDAEQQAIHKSYYNEAGQEIIVENYKTGDVILNWQGKNHFFPSKIDFFLFYFERACIATDSVWYNSLATSFLISRRLPQGPQEDILFWQEGIGNSVPGNMMAILNSQEGRTQRIIVQQKDAYDKLLQLLPANLGSKLIYLGYIYPERSPLSKSKNLLIMTNSDQIEALDILVTGLPEYRFHIGALTEMSAKLMAFDNRNNVKLYPNISAKHAEQLFESCAIYLDINHGNEIISASRQAFEHNQLILAFANTIHQREFVADNHIFAKEAVADMVNYIETNIDQLEQVLAQQKMDSGNATIRDYQEILA